MRVSKLDFSRLCCEEDIYKKWI